MRHRKMWGSRGVVMPSSGRRIRATFEGQDASSRKKCCSLSIWFSIVLFLGHEGSADCIFQR